MKYEITSTENKLIKSVKKLVTDKKYRDATNLFVAESFKVVETLIKNGIKCRNVLVTTNSKYKGNYICNETTVEITEKIYESISQFPNGDGVIAVFNKPKLNFEMKKDGKYIILNKIQNPGNLGTIIRSAIAFNIDGIYITNDCVDLFHPTVIRNSMGNCLTIPILVSTSYFDVIEKLQKEKVECYATTNRPTSVDVNNITFTGGVAVAFGSEGQGLNDKEIRICNGTIKIQINDAVDSLNVAVAAGIIMHKISK